MEHNVQLLNSNGLDMEDSDPVVCECESESDEDGDVKLSEPAVYNKAGLLDKLGVWNGSTSCGLILIKIAR